MASIFLSLLIFISPIKPSPAVSWHTELGKAQQEALSMEKSILMVFSGSDWCKPCIRLNQEVFETDAFKSYAQKNFSLLKVDFPRRRKHKVSKEIQLYRNNLAEQYNPQGLFPRVLVLDAQGKMKKELVYKGGGFSTFLREISE